MMWPRKSKTPDDPQREPRREPETGGAEARKRAEAALADVRRRRAETEPLRRWARGEAQDNNFGRDITLTFYGRGSA